MSRSTRKPWWKDNNTTFKKIQRRRYRHYVRQEVKQWRNRYYYNIIRDCVYCECMDDWETEYWEFCAGLSFELEPNFAPPHKFSDKYDVSDWRFYRDEPEYRRK